MLIRYSPGKYDEKIPVQVQKKIISYNRAGIDKERLILEITGGRKHEVKIVDCAPLMSGENKVKSWLKLVGLFVLLIAFCAGTYNSRFIPKAM